MLDKILVASHNCDEDDNDVQNVKKTEEKSFCGCHHVTCGVCVWLLCPRNAISLVYGRVVYEFVCFCVCPQA